MKFGCFGFSNQIDSISRAGFDSAELDFCELTNMTACTFADFQKKAQTSKLSFEVFSGLIPLTERFHSPDFCLENWLTHTRKGAARAKQLGCRMIPFGAGKCRSIPDNIDPATARLRNIEIVRAFSQVLAEFEIQLVIEPLGPANSNFLNTLPEVNTFLQEVNHPNCSSMCDLRHMHKIKEPLSNLATYRSIVEHAHIDYPRGMIRYFPSPEDGYDYLPYFQALHEADYNGILTVEATSIRHNFTEEASICCNYLHQLDCSSR